MPEQAPAVRQRRIDHGEVEWVYGASTFEGFLRANRHVRPTPNHPAEVAQGGP
jgi:hypothetical protein